ncbi:BgTH12-00140 [Blumeria graminis f. sp. triticale]|uniref:Bgt-2989 n=3 Tax=Blumeria graminis TaxID=34373 RepID=A0A061HMK7_BLUGR|nr:hypothetical protein BGT96224_2989 [Blumeria graminis f. sp. tritici 96224]CAD6504632.1 BgTH12-00140 [Blumeria graminis f. sp. triticale]VDB92664.1 Bgt-2989 [Blumeria graminis f. sp. tritici]
MSKGASPISGARFSDAIKDLPLSTLQIKTAELRNSVAHLDYSNEQLKPFADGSESSLDGKPDKDCIDAISENEVVISRMQERILLLKSEVEKRGHDWQEFQKSENLKLDQEETLNDTSLKFAGLKGNLSEAWLDGTFTTGSIMNGKTKIPQTFDENNLIQTCGKEHTINDSILLEKDEKQSKVEKKNEEEDGMYL